MEGIWLIAFIALWAVVVLQGFFILFLYREVGLHLLNRAEAISRDGLKIGLEAPEVSLPDALSEGALTLGDFRRRPQLVIFGGPQCTACHELLPDMIQFAADQDQVEVVLISSSDLEASRNYAVRNNFRKIRVLADPDQKLYAAFGTRVTPFGFLVDGQGAIRAKGLLNHRDHIELVLGMASREMGVPASELGARGMEGRLAEAEPALPADSPLTVQ